MGLKPLYLLLRVFGRLRSAVRRVVWSRRQPFASVGAVLSFLDGPTGCDPAFCVVWFRFRLLRSVILPFGLLRLEGLYRLLEYGWVTGVLGMVLFIFFLLALPKFDFSWDPHALAWVRLRLPLLSDLAGPMQLFKAALLDAWRNKVTADVCGRKGFRGGSLLDVHGSLQLLHLFSC